MNLSYSNEINKIISSNKDFSEKFGKLIQVFEKRIWTPETCFFFKRLCEDLFKDYGLDIEVKIKTNINGDGVFEIIFKPQPEQEKETAMEAYKGVSFWQKIKNFFKRLFSGSSNVVDGVFDAVMDDDE